MNISSVGSVLNLSKEQVNQFTPRLLPQMHHAQSLYGCSSITGFLSPGQDLQACCLRDRKTLIEKRVSYKLIADRLMEMIQKAKSSSGPILIDEKFKVSINGPYNCSQFCPFSPVSDENASPFTPIKGACGYGNFDVEIVNTKNQHLIKFSSLLPHLIGRHHFFEGDVAYRLPPEEIIDVLELTPEEDFSEEKLLLETTISPLHQTPHRWLLLHLDPFTPDSSMEFEDWCKGMGKQPIILCDGAVKTWVLPYSKFENENVPPDPNFVFAHLFISDVNENMNIAISAQINDIPIETILPTGKHAVFVLLKKSEG